MGVGAFPSTRFRLVPLPVPGRIWSHSILPGTGRGTVRRTVEGAARLADTDDLFDRRANVPKHVSRRNPQRQNAFVCKPRISNSIPLRPVTHVVGDAVDFDRQPRTGTVEIEHIGTGRMLSPKLPAAGTITQRSPQQDLGKAERPAQLASAFDRAFRAPQHRRFPSTMLCMVPLPVPGRNYQRDRQKSSPERGGGPSEGRWRGFSAGPHRLNPTPDSQVTA